MFSKCEAYTITNEYISYRLYLDTVAKKDNRALIIKKTIDAQYNSEWIPCVIEKENKYSRKPKISRRNTRVMKNAP